MSDMQRDQLENELARMTAYTGEETALWKSELEASAKKAERRSIVRTLMQHRSLALAAVLALLLTAVGVVVMMTPRTNNRYAVITSQAPPVSASDSAGVPHRPAAAPGTLRMVQAAQESRRRPDMLGQVSDLAGAGGLGGLPAAAADEFALDEAQRMVISKATLELAAEDVRGTYLRIMQIPSAAHGEYIDDSSLTGSEPDKLHGSVTLRIARDRLPNVLNELRELGHVVSEQSKADDVTGQVVDLEARLRNERRIEEELLELLSKREDAPLKDVLELRRHLQQVRGQIERLTAQRDQIGRLVSLATVLVIIRPERPAPQPELGAYFLENLSASAVAGLRVLADTIAGFVHLAIGGLVWWMIAFTCILIARSLWRRSVLPT